ncbi:uncharacterized protein LOC34617908 [Cyclospora cayetanensis]|uniref:Uncharacterized protein LOC34617908 n=2 Tax=Cyclospora cayetanensis TaxID=88456 RepID=A0A6P5WE70_9EIME|nr:uncharacterized protein LOC34617908 [Cyclospora cayetanensis]OEH79657.1 hypothetical protein cyc_00796 [Cyclospora cayetanensis]
MDLGSVLLEVGGELTVPSISSQEQLAEGLASGKYQLDLSKAEIRMKDNVRQEVFEALGLQSSGLDQLKTQIVLRGLIVSAPPGSHELVRSFLKKGTREQHFAVVRELAKRRRQELELAKRQGSKQGVKLERRGPRMSAEESMAEAPARVESDSGGLSIEVKGAKGMGVGSTTAGEEKRSVEHASLEAAATPMTSEAAISGCKKDTLSPYQYDELSTVRSATTASDLGSARHVFDP